MESLRKPFQGVWNIVRFNWHFYVLALGLVLVILLANHYLNGRYSTIAVLAIVLITAPMLVSLLVSFYVYDLAGLYKLSWLEELGVSRTARIITINAGFDETSHLVKNHFPDSELLVLDFYDPEKHTEVSIKRARKAYAPFPGTRQIETTSPPLPSLSANLVVVIFSAHEIRNEQERISFFCELNRILKPDGQIAVTEHLRDVPNFLAYTIGFLHFYSKSSWLRVFQKAALQVKQEIKITPFVSTFILTRNGAAH